MQAIQLTEGKLQESSPFLLGSPQLCMADPRFQRHDSGADFEPTQIADTLEGRTGS